jgi:hypothetical protein
MGLSNIILEGDTLQIVNAVKTTGTNWSNFGHIVDEIKLIRIELAEIVENRTCQEECEYNRSYHSSIIKGLLFCLFYLSIIVNDPELYSYQD